MDCPNCNRTHPDDAQRCDCGYNFATQTMAPPPGAEAVAEVQVDPGVMEQFLAKLEAEQNLRLGAFAGAVAALVGAGLWTLVTVITKYQIGWMAVGVGFLVGYAMRIFGRGIHKAFGIIGAVLALLGCLAGNLFSVCYFVAVQQEMPYLEVLARLDPALALELMAATFSPMDLLFYGIAIYEGYRFSFRRVSEEELVTLSKTGQTGS